MITKLTKALPYFSSSFKISAIKGILTIFTKIALKKIINKIQYMIKKQALRYVVEICFLNGYIAQITKINKSAGKSEQELLAKAPAIKKKIDSTKNILLKL
jgi:predicted RNA-binding protein